MEKSNKDSGEGHRLNKYIADCGYCSRRKADEMIFAGRVTINGETVLTPGYKVGSKDVVTAEGSRLKLPKKYYILLNKSRDSITTTHDERKRKTVMDLVKGACDERIYPVGRLDRNTTGLLLLTNDGGLANRLTHPSGEVRKVYRVTLDKNVSYTDILKIRKGVFLEDGIARTDEVNHENKGTGNVIIISLHSGKNRIIRRIFEYLGYKVKELDRIGYGGLTLYGLPRGRWRYLKEDEIKHLYKKLTD